MLQWEKDGLSLTANRYSVATYSVNLSLPPTRTWTTAFILKREENQFPLASVLHIPTVDQFDDWEDFLALSEGVGQVDSQGDPSVGTDTAQGDSMEALEKVMRKRALARADTARVVEESLLDAVRMGEDEYDGEGRDSWYFSLVRRSDGS